MEAMLVPAAVFSLRVISVKHAHAHAHATVLSPSLLYSSLLYSVLLYSTLLYSTCLVLSPRPHTHTLPPHVIPIPVPMAIPSPLTPIDWRCSPLPSSPLL